jgi:hypothetical protein
MNFDYFCSQAPLLLCPLVGPPGGIEPRCFSRTIELGSILIFEPAVIAIHLCAVIMTAIMIIHVRSKYTAVGRQGTPAITTEILLFFYLYAITTIMEFLCVSGVITLSSPAYGAAGYLYINI